MRTTFSLSVAGLLALVLTLGLSTQTQTGCSLRFTAPDDALSCEPSKQQGNPINAAIGNKYQKEEDLRGAGVFPLLFSRHYNSLDGYWRHNYAVRLRLSATAISLVHAAGWESRFSLSGGGATADPRELGRLVQSASGWRYSSVAEEVFDFDSQGPLTKQALRGGQALLFSYVGGSVAVSDGLSSSLRFTQDERYQSLSLRAPGLTISYSHDATARLSNLTRAQGGQATVRRFHYEDPRYPRFLGITGERGVRYVAWIYDAQGRAISSEHAGGADKVLIAYNADAFSTVNNELGKRITYRFEVIQGVKRISAINGEPSANCPNSNASFSDESRGQIKSRTDNKGFVTTYDYNERGLEVRRAEAVGTPQARTSLIEWHATRDLPVKVSEPGHVITYS